MDMTIGSDSPLVCRQSKRRRVRYMFNLVVDISIVDLDYGGELIYEDRSDELPGVQVVAAYTILPKQERSSFIGAKSIV